MEKKKRFFTLKYFSVLVLVALAITGAIVLLVNDAFAITAPAGEAEVNIHSGSTDGEIADVLKDAGLIKSRLWFRSYLKLRGKELIPKGEDFRIPYGSGFDGIHRILNYGSEPSLTEVRVSIPEGATVEDIMRIVCDEHGICSRADFSETVKNGDFSKYSFLPTERETLEGYLYPDTYYFYSECSAYTVIDKMLENFNKKLDGRYRLACEKQGMSINDAVTLASVIIKEAKFTHDYPKVSSVFHNRLKSPAFGKRLQSDATLVYALGREMTADDKELDSPYNTYKYGGLPPTPIANPDLDAISYALYPDSTPYYYFVTLKDGSVLYARDYASHLRNVQKASSE